MRIPGWLWSRSSESIRDTGRLLFSRNPPASESLQLINLATHDILTAVQLIASVVELLEIELADHPEDAAAFVAGATQRVKVAIGNFLDFTQLVRSQKISLNEFGRRLDREVGHLCQVIDPLEKNIAPVAKSITSIRLSAGARSLRYSAKAVCALILGMGDWHQKSSTALDLGSLLSEIVVLHHPAASARKLKLFFSEMDEAVYVDAPAWAVSTVLTNLVGNAIKYTDIGTVSVSIAMTLKTVQVQVVDTGIGMDEEFLRKITKPGMRANSGVDAHCEGQGLGLALAKYASRAVGGTLRFSSRLGIGTQAIFRMPVLMNDESN